VGLDRASAFSKDPDRSVVSVVGKTILPGLVGKRIPIFGPKGDIISDVETDGSFYVWFGAWEYLYSLADPIKSKITDIDNEFGIDAMELEQYQASDLGEWAKEERFGDKTQVRHMTAQAKQQLVEFVHNLIVTRRFMVSPYYAVLRAEMSNYREDNSKGGIPRYKGRLRNMELPLYPSSIMDALGEPELTRTWIKDDYWESGMWALDAARSAETRTITGKAVVDKPAGL
jgi:hypothetical protein